jgi:CP family cyanate transporter-like MFS transporter
LNRPFWIALTLLWLVGNSLRLTVLAVPPVIPRITADLGLSATEVGILGSIPPALFALASVPGALLIARVGMLRALVIGMLLTAAGGALRGLSYGAGVLFATSILMALGVAFMQTALPSAVQQWIPTRIGFGTAVYTNGLLTGETFPVFLTLPLVLPWFAGAWRPALAVWSVPVLLTALLVARFAPRQPAAPRSAGATGGAPVRRHWWPDWRDGLIWQLGLLGGGISSMYFATNAFLPGYLASIGRPDLTGSALTALNLGQLPASLLLLALADRMERRAWPYVAAGAASLLSVIGIVASAGVGTVVWAGVLGFCGSAGLILALSLPALLSRPEAVASTASAMFAITYATAVVVGVVSGALWDATGVPAAAFVPIGLGAVALVASAAVLRLKGRLR